MSSSEPWKEGHGAGGLSLDRAGAPLSHGPRDVTPARELTLEICLPVTTPASPLPPAWRFLQCQNLR